MQQRRARVSGWIPLEGPPAVPGGKPSLGGMIDVSRTGARLYLGTRVRPGDFLPLVLRLPEEPLPIRFHGRVVWAIADDVSRVETFDARMKLLQEMVHRDHSAHAVPFGWLCGMRFDPDVDRIAIHRLQRAFEEENPRDAKRVFHTRGPADTGSVLDLGATRVEWDR